MTASFYDKATLPESAFGHVGIRETSQVLLLREYTLGLLLMGYSGGELLGWQ